MRSIVRHSKAKRSSHPMVAWLGEAVGKIDGTKLRTIHRGSGGLNAYVDSIDYVGNLILKNGQPEMYLFDGGYASFNSNGAVNGWHYYISDYMGNNRMVVNKNGTTEQVTHYYPYGGSSATSARTKACKPTSSRARSLTAPSDWTTMTSMLASISLWPRCGTGLTR